MSLNKDMGTKHEQDLHAALGGRMTKGSGNQWQNPADGRHSRYEEVVALAWDGKSTYGKSISITREMIAKIKEQASPEAPMLGLRFYDPEAGTARLKVDEDWVALPLNVLVTLLDAARSPEPGYPCEECGYVPSTEATT